MTSTVLYSNGLVSHASHPASRMAHDQAASLLNLNRPCRSIISVSTSTRHLLLTPRPGTVLASETRTILAGTPQRVATSGNTAADCDDHAISVVTYGRSEEA